MVLILSIFLPTGAILRLPIWGDPADDNCFDDAAYWEVRLLPSNKKGFDLQRKSGVIYTLIVLSTGANRRGDRPTDAAVQQPLPQQRRVSVHLIHPSTSSHGDDLLKYERRFLRVGKMCCVQVPFGGSRAQFKEGWCGFLALFSENYRKVRLRLMTPRDHGDADVSTDDYQSLM